MYLYQRCLRHSWSQTSSVWDTAYAVTMVSEHRWFTFYFLGFIFYLHNVETEFEKNIVWNPCPNGIDFSLMYNQILKTSCWCTFNAIIGERTEHRIEASLPTISQQQGAAAKVCWTSICHYYPFNASDSTPVAEGWALRTHRKSYTVPKQAVCNRKW